MFCTSDLALFSYVGPGGGLALLGSLITLVIALMSALFFVLLWPIRMLFRKIKPAPASNEGISKEVVNQEQAEITQ